MMKGTTGGRKFSIDEQNYFFSKYRKVAEWVDENTPRVSAGALGAIGKGILWYGLERMTPFCKSLKSGTFRGVGDPVHVLFLWLRGRAKPTANNAFRMAVSAIRAFLNDRDCTRDRGGVRRGVTTMHPAITDIFEWSSDFNKMNKMHNNKVLQETRIPAADLLSGTQFAASA